jgi:hypothetical protein
MGEQSRNPKGKPRAPEPPVLLSHAAVVLVAAFILLSGIVAVLPDSW